MKTFCVFLFVSVSLQTVFGQTGTTCKRTNGGVGSCVDIQNCDYYVHIVKELGKAQATSMLKEAQCNHEASHPKICCPNLQCSTPQPGAVKAVGTSKGPPCDRATDGVGSCIPIESCEYYGNITNELGLRQASDMLKKAICGFEGHHAMVCCPNILCSSTSATNNATEPSPLHRVAEFLDPPVCGLSKGSLRRVVGGIPAKLDDYPWMALLGYMKKRGREWGCGGALISERHVLTAGHCIYGHEDILNIVRLGELDYGKEDEGAHPIDVQIKKMIVHEEFDPNTSSNDIGVLILQQDIVFTKSIRPICIPKGKWRKETFEKYTPFVAGWGATSFRSGMSSSHLQVIQLPVRKNDECINAFKLYRDRVIDQRVMCVGSNKGGQDSCDGDSGGPLMQLLAWNDRKLYYYVTGVVSYGLQCGLPQYPSIYTRVTYFLPWIEEKVLGRATR